MQLIHFLKFLLKLDNPRSQVTENEYTLLMKHSKDADVIVEVGCFEGATSVGFAKNTGGKVYGVDPFILKDKLGICYGEWIAKIQSLRNHVSNITFLKGFSFEVAHSFDAPIDFLFIDADHSYDAIVQDWKDWTPKVRNGGIIALHDCIKAPNSPEHLGTMRFYEEDLSHIDGIQEIETIDSLTVLRVSR